MPKGDMDWSDILLFTSIAIVVAAFGFVGALEGWRRWSDNRRIRKHLRN
jgi:hypothetical protein